MLLQNKDYFEYLAARLINRYGCGYSKDDLIQTARLELLRISENFNPARGAKLLTYADRFIKAAMEKEIISQLNMAGFPFSRFRKIRRAYAIYTQGGGESDRERIAAVCNGMNISNELAVQYLTESQFISSLRLCEIQDISVTDVWNAPLDPYKLPPELYYIRKETV